MIKTISISGMTCINCEKSIHEKITSLAGVNKVVVILKNQNAIINSKNIINNENIQEAIGAKYSISDLEHSKKENKIWQLKPLLLIFAYLFFGTYYLNKNDFSLEKVMVDFMGLFFLIFSFFKFLDYSTFPLSFSKYDPLAKKSIIYARLYPFLELFLGVCFLFNWKIQIASIVTLCILSITTFGVIKILFNKSEIECACLGTSMNLPMTEATLVENLIMISMAISLLI